MPGKQVRMLRQADARILIIEDNEANLMLLQRILAQAGYEKIRSVTDARQAMASYAVDRPDLVLLDLHMPHIDGFEILAQLRRKFRPEDLAPVLVLTADSTAATRYRALQAGAKDFLTKPLDAQEVLLRTANLLEMRQLYQKLRGYSAGLENKIQENTAELLEKNIELENAQERIEDMGQRLQRILDNTLTAVITSTPEGAILDCNLAFAHMLGYESAEQVRAISAWDIHLHPEARRDLIKKLEHEAALHHVRMQLRNRQGEPIVLLANLNRRIQPGVGPVIEGVAIDLTAYHRLEMQYQQAQKMECVGRLVASIAHDFNNLMTVISGYAEMARRQTAEAEKLHRSLRLITETTERASALTQQLLSFSRPDPGRQCWLEMKQTIQEMIPMLSQALGRNIRLQCALPEEPVHTHLNPSQLEQVMMNLAVNARDAMPQGGQFMIELQCLPAEQCPEHLPASAAGWAKLRLADTGTGMDKATREHIFEPFFTTKAGKGTGLGLATVYNIVRQWEGMIEVSSEPGHGTEFLIYLKPESYRPRDVEAGADARREIIQ